MKSEEVLYALLSVFVLYLCASVLNWAFRRYTRLQILKKHGIPGPKPSFLSGNLYDLRDQPNPNGIISRWLKEYGDVFGYYVGEVPYVVVKDLHILKQVMISSFPNFRNRPDMFLDIWPLNQTVIQLENKRWKEVRSILAPTFSTAKIKLMTSIVHKKVDITIQEVSKRAEKNEMFDIYELVQGLTLDVIADCALAMQTNCQVNPKDTFLVAVRDFFLYAHNKVVDFAIMFPLVASILTFISNYMTSGKMTSIIVDNVKTAIQVRRTSKIKRTDMLQLMLDHDRENDVGGNSSSSLTDNEIIANAYAFILAGYETTATALAFTFYLLVRHPDVQRRLQKEIDGTGGAEDYDTVQSLQYLDQVFSESLRFYPPVTGFVVRKCSSSFQVESHTIPKDAIVLAPVWDIHHDPELWADPWKFDPDRFSPENKDRIHNLSYIPFGIGPRSCIGVRFAKLEAKMTIFRLFKKFTFEACEKTDDPLPLICPTVIINPKNGVYVRAKLRQAESRQC